MVTPETFKAAVQDLTVRHVPLTVRAIRDEIGGGSFSTITRLLTAHRNGHERARERRMLQLSICRTVELLVADGKISPGAAQELVDALPSFDFHRL